jgi:hypothetical protein
MGDVKVRGALVNEHTGEALGFMFNPQQLTRNLTVNWGKSAALSATFERLHYQNTANEAFDLTLTHNLPAWVNRTRAGATINEAQRNVLRQEFEYHWRFLRAFCYPRGRPADVLKRSPPTGLLVWPNYLTVRLVVNTLQRTDNTFDDELRPIAFDATLNLQEARTYRLTSDDVLRGKAA